MHLHENTMQDERIYNDVYDWSIVATEENGWVLEPRYTQVSIIMKNYFNSVSSTFVHRTIHIAQTNSHLLQIFSKTFPQSSREAGSYISVPKIYAT